MNRKSFIRNLFGATVAVIIDKKLPVPDRVPEYIVGYDPYSKPGIGGKSFVVKLNKKFRMYPLTYKEALNEMV